MVVFIFSDLEWKYPFWGNLIQKIKIVSLSWNSVPRLIWICRIHWYCSLFLFLTGNTLLGQILSLKLRFATWKFQIRRIRNLLTFFQFLPDILFLGKIVPKNQNYQFKLKFGTLTNSNMQKSLVMFFFSFWRETPFWGKFYPWSWSWYLEVSNTQNS